LKDKFGTVCKVIVILLVALLMCSGVMFIFDSGFNGAVGDWFKNSFIQIHSGKDFYAEVLQWSKLKSFLTFLAIGLVALWTVTAICFFAIGRVGMTKKVSQNTARLIRDYFVLEEGTLLVPEKYGDISRYLSEIKQQHEDRGCNIIGEVCTYRDTHTCKMLCKQCLQIRFHDVSLDHGYVVIVGKCFLQDADQRMVDLDSNDLCIHFTKILCHGADPGPDLQDRILRRGTAFLGNTLWDCGIDQKVLTEFFLKGNTMGRHEALDITDIRQIQMKFLTFYYRIMVVPYSQKDKRCMVSKFIFHRIRKTS